MVKPQYLCGRFPLFSHKVNHTLNKRHTIHHDTVPATGPSYEILFVIKCLVTSFFNRIFINFLYLLLFAYELISDAAILILFHSPEPTRLILRLFQFSRSAFSLLYIESFTAFSLLNALAKAFSSRSSFGIPLRTI